MTRPRPQRCHSSSLIRSKVNELSYRGDRSRRRGTSLTIGEGDGPRAARVVSRSLGSRRTPIISPADNLELSLHSLIRIVFWSKKIASHRELGCAHGVMDLPLWEGRVLPVPESRVFTGIPASSMAITHVAALFGGTTDFLRGTEVFCLLHLAFSEDDPSWSGFSNHLFLCYGSHGRVGVQRYVGRRTPSLIG